MPIQGYVEYQRREYCKDIRCPIQVILDREQPDSARYEEIRNICKNDCIHSTYEFHHWLIGKGYLLVRPAE
jgi:Iap family predicted aminopeptidase